MEIVSKLQCLVISVSCFCRLVGWLVGFLLINLINQNNNNNNNIDNNINNYNMHNQESLMENEKQKVLRDFKIEKDHLIPARWPDLVIVHKKNTRTKRNVDFAALVDYRAKSKEIKKKHKYLDLARERNKLWNTKVIVIPIVIGSLGTILKGLVRGLNELEIRRRTETIQTTALLRSTRILRSVLKTWGHLLSLSLMWKTIRYRWFEKTSPKIIIIRRNKISR